MAPKMFMMVMVLLISSTTTVRAQLSGVLGGTNTIQIFPDNCFNVALLLVQNAQTILTTLETNPQNTATLASTILAGGDFLGLGLNTCLSKVTDQTLLNCLSQAASLAVNLILSPNCPTITAEIVKQQYNTLLAGSCSSLLSPLPLP